MGSVLSVPTALSIALISGGIFYGFVQKRPPPPDWAAPSNRAVLPGDEQPQQPSEKKSKKKKKAAAPSASATEVEPTVVRFPAVVPGGFDAAGPAESTPAPAPAAAAAKQKKKKKSKKPATAAGIPLDAQSDSSATAPESSTPAARPQAKRKSTPVLDDGPWTRVESRKRTTPAPAAGSSAAPELERAASDVGITTSVTGTSSPVAERTEDEQPGSEAQRRTLAERLQPKPRKTHVEDMLETPDVPPLARVMRVQPRPDERPAAGFSWADYEDVDESRITADDADGEDDSGWIVKGSQRPRTRRPSSQTAQSAPETITKKQRQNLAKRDAQKAAKAEAEAERQATLAKHKRELERARMAEQYAQGKKHSGGMKAAVDAKGHLVFE